MDAALALDYLTPTALISSPPLPLPLHFYVTSPTAPRLDAAACVAMISKLGLRNPGPSNLWPSKAHVVALHTTLSARKYICTDIALHIGHLVMYD